jgi:hypothetical protein
LNVQLRKLIEEAPTPVAEIEARLREAHDERVILDATTLLSVQSSVEMSSARFRDDPQDLDRLESLESLVAVVRDAQLKVNMRQPQNDYYVMKGTVRPVIAAGANGSADAKRWLQLFDALGEKLAISPEAHDW